MGCERREMAKSDELVVVPPKKVETTQEIIAKQRLEQSRLKADIMRHISHGPNPT